MLSSSSRLCWSVYFMWSVLPSMDKLQIYSKCTLDKVASVYRHAVSCFNAWKKGLRSIFLSVNYYLKRVKISCIVQFLKERYFYFAVWNEDSFLISVTNYKMYAVISLIVPFIVPFITSWCCILPERTAQFITACSYSSL